MTYEAAKARSQAQFRARARLTELHPEEYAQLLAEELRSVGLPPELPGCKRRQDPAERGESRG